MTAIREMLDILKVAWDRVSQQRGGCRFWAFVQEAQLELNDRLPVAR